MRIPRIAKIVSPIVKKIGKAGDWAGDKLARATEGKSKLSKGFSKAVDLFEPNGGDNTFFALASIMLGAVLIPRIKTAMKRNPDNKEATKDEITEIAFRDVQTILIMLFGLKTMNSIVANLGTKITGIPMVDKPFKNLFGKNIKGFADKAQDVIQHPIQKLKTISSNILDALNPIGGSSSLNGKKIQTLYTNYASAHEVRKLLNDVPQHGGSKEKVFQKIKKSIIARIDNKIASTKASSRYIPNTGKFPVETQRNINGLMKTKEYFENLKLEDFMRDDFKMAKGYEQELIDLFADKKNPIALTATWVNDWLRMLALGIEISYLGFGLPALNQKRLEKKYLKNPTLNNQDSFSPINDRHIKAQEIKLYSQFIK